jgi:uncharacterized glyoxalase superfamily protein PhnB
VSAPALRAHAHVLAVPDLARSVGYFRDVLGFAVEWEDGRDWACLASGTARVMLGHCPDAPPPRAIGDHSYFAYFHVDGLDRYHDDLVARGALVASPPSDKPWGMREMGVHTPDGHRMMFGTPWARR